MTAYGARAAATRVPRRRRTPDEIRRERAVRVGTLVIGAAAGLAAGYIARRADRTARERGLVDWVRVEELATAQLRAAQGALPRAELIAAEPAYARAMARIVPLLEERLGQPLPGVVERHEVVDRAGWARANIVTFRTLVTRLEEAFHDKLHPANPTLGGSLANIANRFLTTQQLGFLLGYLGSRVLGQYDVALLTAEAPPGRLLFVEENVRQTAKALGVPVEDFRVWIALHETTHAFEFEAHPWLRPYLAERLERQLAAFLEEAKAWSAEGAVELLKRWRRPEGEPLFAGLLTAEQRRLLRETQLVMSLLEGFSDWVMDEVGASLVADVGTLRERFEARRNQRRRGLDKLIGRLTGLDMKLEQYRRGERFVSGVAAAGGREAIGLLFAGPHALPSEAEMADPAAWVCRMLPARAEGGSPA